MDGTSASETEFEHAVLTADGDSELVNLARELLRARAETDISYSTYGELVEHFRDAHPAFYGNFFGDPFYATYDIEYVRMARQRDLASLEADPWTGLPGLFSCHPLTYDPAFGGLCRGFQFASAFFFFPPSGTSYTFAGQDIDEPRPPAHINCDEWSLPVPECRHSLFQEGKAPTAVASRAPAPESNAFTEWDASDDQNPKGEDETSQRPSERILELPKAPDLIDPVVPGDERPDVDLPDDLQASMQETVSSLRRQATLDRARKIVENRYRGSELSAHEREELASQLAKIISVGGGSSSRGKAGTAAERGFPLGPIDAGGAQYIRRPADGSLYESGSVENSSRPSNTPDVEPSVPSTPEAEQANSNGGQGAPTRSGSPQEAGSSSDDGGSGS